MGASVPSQVLAGQHRQIDAGVDGIVKGSGTAAALSAALALLRSHLYAEEAVLFPPLVQTGLAMPVFVMKREHGQMWPLMDSLAKVAAADVQPAALQADCKRLFQLLQMHNPKEESIVYTAADRLAATRGDTAWSRPLDGITAPDGWICEMAPH